MDLLKDFRYAIRRLSSDWRFTLAAALTLSLGIGANATVFTIANALMLRDLPFTDHDRVVSLGSQDTQGHRFAVSFRDFEDWRAAKSLAGMAMWGTYTWNVIDPVRDPDRYWGAYISGNIFQLMGQKPLLGRDFLPGDDQPTAPPVVIFSHNVWQNRYGSDPNIIGRVVSVSQIPATVIGVMPPDMNFPPNTDAWIPIAFMPPAVRNLNRNARNYGALARLADGVTLQQARAELTGIGAGLATTYPDTNKNISPTIQTFGEQMSGGDDTKVLSMLMGAVAFVLLIACANVANLLLARSANRTREVGVRIAIGATRWRIVRQLLAESVLLSLVGGLFGIGIGIVALRIFVMSTTGAGWPYWVHFTMDAYVIGFLAVICLGTAVMFGLAPALHVSKTDVNHVLKEGGRTGMGSARSRRWAGALITIELALTLVLLSGAGLMMRSFMSLYAREVGFNTSKLLVMSLSLPSRKYPTPASRATFYARLEDRLGNIPAVRAGTVASHSPMAGFASRPLAIEGRDASGDREPLSVDIVSVGPKYFDALDVHLPRGRAFVSTDGQPGQEHVIVNQDFVTKYLPKTDPIGVRLRLSDPSAAAPSSAGAGSTPSTQQPLWYTIVGVTPTINQRGLQSSGPQPIVYVPHQTVTFLFARLLVRTETNAAAMAPLVRTELRAIDPDIPIVDIMTMDQFVSLQARGPVVIGMMFSIFAIVALALSAVGLYALTAHSVVQRTPEIGIRMALGAQPEQVWWMFFRGLLFYLAVGVTLGLAGAVAVGTLLRSLLFDVGPFDPTTLVGTVIVLTTAAVAACFWPARQATRVDPMIALRYE